MSDTEAATSGATLRAARRRRGLDVDTASRNSALPAAVVQALEACNAASLAADVRLQAQLRVYARSLGVDPEPLLRQLGPRPLGDPGDAAAPMGPPPPQRAPRAPRTPRTPRAPGIRSRRAPLALVWLGVGAVVGAAVAFVVLSLGGFGAASEPGVRLTVLPTQDDTGRAGDRDGLHAVVGRGRPEQ